MTDFPETHVFPDAATLAHALADALLEAANAALVARGSFQLVLAGGSTPRALYAELAVRHAGDARWHIWYGDERCLPPDDTERNSAMAESVWLAASRIPSAQRRPIPAERGAEAGARAYADALTSVGEFDLVLLGLGEDGHTASLFPGKPWHTPEAAIAVHNAPKPPPDRVSLSADRLSNSRQVWFVITGAGKREAIARWHAGESIPASTVRGQQGTVCWLDAAAANAAGSRAV